MKYFFRYVNSRNIHEGKISSFLSIFDICFLESETKIVEIIPYFWIPMISHTKRMVVQPSSLTILTDFSI